MLRAPGGDLFRIPAKQTLENKHQVLNKLFGEDEFQVTTSTYIKEKISVKFTKPFETISYYESIKNKNFIHLPSPSLFE